MTALIDEAIFVFTRNISGKCSFMDHNCCNRTVVFNHKLSADLSRILYVWEIFQEIKYSNAKAWTKKKSPQEKWCG